jgi:hypothetical protein
MSSSIDHESGVVTVTGSGYTWAAPGHRLYLIGSPGARVIGDHREWLRRFIAPPTSNGNAHNVGVDCAEAELALSQRLGLVHESLVAETV